MIKIYKKYEEIINYVIMGVLTTIVSLATYYILVLTILNPLNAIELQIANIISWIVSVTFAYVTNRKFVFKSTNKNVLKEAINFFVSRISTLLIDMGLMFLFVTELNFNDKTMKLVDQIIVIILNYVLSKLFVFKKNKKNVKN